MRARPPTYDPSNDEAFSRVVGRRARRPVGEPPASATFEALAQMANYRTRAPKGVFRYRTHEEANQDRERWTLDAMLAAAGDGEVPR